MSATSAEKHNCPFCGDRLYLAFTTPLTWVHTSTDSIQCKGAKQ